MENRIAALRNQQGIKQTALAAAVGWNQDRLSNYELGKRSVGLADCRAIVAAFNRLGVSCTLDDVFPPEPITAQAA
ncbi:helix-turn-helix transcriptional regulator [Pseudomonas aeruginosa]|uniref:helix-turn-helix transcriptional regulator n=1 Tax=Pseudomonas aeruginosa TaxID=287 RepID=UPI00180D06AC